MFQGFRRIGTACLFAAMIVGGCGNTTSGIEGISCTAQSDCNSGLSCLDYYTEGDSGVEAGCSSVGKVCLQPCTTSSDCTIEGYVCFTACGGAPACLPASGTVAPPDDAAPESSADATIDTATAAATDATTDVASQ